MKKIKICFQVDISKFLCFSNRQTQLVTNLFRQLRMRTASKNFYIAHSKSLFQYNVKNYTVQSIRHKNYTNVYDKKGIFLWNIIRLICASRRQCAEKELRISRFLENHPETGSFRKNFCVNISITVCKIYSTNMSYIIRSLDLNIQTLTLNCDPLPKISDPSFFRIFFYFSLVRSFPKLYKNRLTLKIKPLQLLAFMSNHSN